MDTDPGIGQSRTRTEVRRQIASAFAWLGAVVLPPVITYLGFVLEPRFGHTSVDRGLIVALVVGCACVAILFRKTWWAIPAVLVYLAGMGGVLFVLGASLACVMEHACM